MSDLGSTSLFYSSRPEILLDGQPDSGLSDGVMSLMVEENIEGLARCEITFGNWGAGENGTGFLYFKRDILEFGKEIAVRIGEGDTVAKVFDGRIMALDASFPKMRPPEMTVLAEDRLQDLRMRRRTRTFEEVTDEDVFRSIASEHSLQPQIDITGPSYSVLAQVNQSNLAFLRQRAAAIDAELWIDGNTLNVKSRSRRETNAVTLTYGKGLQELSLCADLACQQTKFTVSGWEPGAKDTIRFEATSSVLGSELNGDLSGSSILQSAVGERTQALVHTKPLNNTEAQTVATACFRRMARRFVTGRCVSQGDGRIRVGTHVTLQGVGDLFEGEYYVCEVQHLFDSMNGYQCCFHVERPGIKAV